MDVQQFLAQPNTKQGKLAPWEAEIFALHRAHVSYEKIAEFLRLHRVHVCKIEVYRYIHRDKRRHLLQGARSAERVTVTLNAGKPEPQQPTDSNESATDGVPSQGNDSTLPKFNWQQSRSRDKPTW